MSTEWSQSIYGCSTTGSVLYCRVVFAHFTKSDIRKIISNRININDNDVVSRVEQELCVEAEVFAGTMYSSWTGTVIEERFSKQNIFFIQDRLNFRRQPDPFNRTFYLDIESCDCDWNQLNN